MTPFQRLNFLSSPFLPMPTRTLWAYDSCQNANTALKFGIIVGVETSRYLILWSVNSFEVLTAKLGRFATISMYMVIVANGYGCTQGLFWLPWRIILGDYPGWPGELNWSNSELAWHALSWHMLPLSLLPMPLPKREYNAVSANADEIW